MNFGLKFLHPSGRWWFIGCWLYAGYVYGTPLRQRPPYDMADEVSKSWPWVFYATYCQNCPGGWLMMVGLECFKIQTYIFATRFSFNTEPLMSDCFMMVNACICHRRECPCHVEGSWSWKKSMLEHNGDVSHEIWVPMGTLMIRKMIRIFSMTLHCIIIWVYRRIFRHS